MTLIKSISGIRGTIGGKPGDNLTPSDILRFTIAFTRFIQKSAGRTAVKIAVGRDARISGDMVNRLVTGSLMGMGAHVVDLGLSTTPTVELAVPALSCDAGIILTASHNPKEWNALKLLNGSGEFISAAEGESVLKMAEEDQFDFADVDHIGTYSADGSWLDKHIEAILSYELVDAAAIRGAKLKVVCDCVNSTGGIFVPALLNRLGVEQVFPLYCAPNGQFPHNPEPLPAHLTDLSAEILRSKAHLGFVVDPDVDRLAVVCEDGSMFGEEYTLVAVADYVLSKRPGNTVSNLSSTRALRDVTHKHGGVYSAAAVGEVNVVSEMKAVKAVIGGEGNGGIIVPDFHYGRDALIGIALFLTHYVKQGLSCSALRDSYPAYAMSKQKISLTPDIDVDAVLAHMAQQYKGNSPSLIDGVKIDFADEWVHLRKSNTEPIIRVYAESSTEESAMKLADRIREEIGAFVKK